MEKRVVVVGLRLRYEVDEHELYPTYGELYSKGYVYADRGEEDLYLLTQPLPEGVELAGNELAQLHELGYEVEELEAVYSLDDVLHLELVACKPE